MKKLLVIFLYTSLLAGVAGISSALPLINERFSGDIPIVPPSEPVSMLLFGFGLLGLASAGRKHLKK